MKHYRYRDGRFRSRKEVKIKRQFIALMTLMLAPIIACNVMYWFGYEVQVTATEQAHEITQTVLAYEEEAELEEPLSSENYPSIEIIEYDPSTAAADTLSRGLGSMFGDPNYEVTQETRNRIAYIFKQAEKLNIAPLPVVYTIYCESLFYNVQSNVVDSAGNREDSWGLAQLHLPSHKHVTRDQALNPYWAIDWMLENWNSDLARAGKMWFGYDRETATCTNGLPAYWQEQ